LRSNDSSFGNQAALGGRSGIVEGVLLTTEHHQGGEAVQVVGDRLAGMGAYHRKLEAPGREPVPQPARIVGGIVLNHQTGRVHSSSLARNLTGVIRPRLLLPGDLVSLVSPSGPTRPERVARGVAMLEGWGLRVAVAPHAYERSGYFAGADALRLADLNAALAEPAVRGLICTRGGYGVQRLLDDLDMAAVRADPKLVVGLLRHHRAAVGAVAGRPPAERARPGRRLAGRAHRPRVRRRAEACAHDHRDHRGQGQAG
jgi:hypothetical protein